MTIVGKDYQRNEARDFSLRQREDRMGEGTENRFFIHPILIQIHPFFFFAHSPGNELDGGPRFLHFIKGAGPLRWWRGNEYLPHLFGSY